MFVSNGNPTKCKLYFLSFVCKKAGISIKEPERTFENKIDRWYISMDFYERPFVLDDFYFVAGL